MTRYSIDSSVNQIYPKDESAPKDFLFPHMPQKKQVSPTRILQTRRTRHWGSQSPGLSWSLQHSWQRSWPLTPGCQYPPAAAATRMPPAVAKCPRGWAGGRIAPVENHLCCPCFPVTGEKTPGTQNRKEPPTLQEPERAPGALLHFPGLLPPRTTAPSAKRGAPSRSAWPPPHRRAGSSALCSLRPALPWPLPFALWEGVAHRMPGWARCRGRKADRTTGRRKPSLGLTPDFRLQGGGVLLPRGKPQKSKTKSLLKPDSSVAV